MTRQDRQTRAFLIHLGIAVPDPELPEPIRAEWTRRDRRTERMMFDVGTFEPFMHYDSEVTFDGEEVYHVDQLRDIDLGALEESGRVEVEYEGRDSYITVRRRDVTMDRLPRYVKADIVSGARGAGRFQYRTGRVHAT